MHKFDYSFLSSGSIPVSILNLISLISKGSGISAVRKELHPKIFSDLEKIARIQSVKSSNAIEGIVTSDDRLRAIVLNQTAPLNHNEAEIAGYRDVLSRIHNEYASIEFNEHTILEFHRLLLSHTGCEYGGKYKAAETPQAMEQLLFAYLEARDTVNIHPLLLIPCVILDFLCIHPFRDGNGRISRLLSLLLLYQNGYDIGRYISFEEAINRDKFAYYDALKQSSVNWHENKENPFCFIEHFLLMLANCYTEIETRYNAASGMSLTKSAMIEKYVCNAVNPVGKADICASFPEISPTTVEAVLGKLVKANLIEKIGSSRTTRYIPVKERKYE